MLAVAQRGIRGWSSSGRAGSSRRCQHGCCQSPGERSPEEHVSAGMHGSSAKSKGSFPPRSGAQQALLALKAVGAERETMSHPVPHQHLKAPGKPGWAEPHSGGSTLGRVRLLWAGFRPSKSILTPTESEGRGALPLHAAPSVA